MHWKAIRNSFAGIGKIRLPLDLVRTPVRFPLMGNVPFFLSGFSFRRFGMIYVSKEWKRNHKRCQKEAALFADKE